MKKYKMDFDDTETLEDMLADVEEEFGKMTSEEIDELFKKTFGDNAAE